MTDLTEQQYAQLVGMLKPEEGLPGTNGKPALKPYRDTKGKLSIGWGHNLDDDGINNNIAEFILRDDIENAVQEAKRDLPWFEGLTENRQVVIVNMVFNMGAGGVLGFHRAIAAIEKDDWDGAADEFLDSEWHRDVGARAEALMDIWRKG